MVLGSPQLLTTAQGIPIVTPEKIEALSGVPHAMPYQGSKRALAHAIVRLVPEDTGTLVEPFAGSAAVSIAARYLGLVDRCVLVDVNAPLARLWSRIIEDPEVVAARYEEQIGRAHV